VHRHSAALHTAGYQALLKRMKPEKVHDLRKGKRRA
jgi:hypothetical protein